MNRAILHCLFNYHRLIRQSRRPEGENRTLQWQALRRQISWAKENVPYYRKNWTDAETRRLENEEAFRGIPLLSKEQVRAEAPESFMPQGRRSGKLWRTQTSGSTGIPTVVYRSAETEAWTRAFVYYSFASMGVGFTDRICSILAMSSERPLHKGFAEKLGFRRYLPISLHETEETIISRVLELRPRALYSFPSVLVKLADYIRKKNIYVPLRCLISHGEETPESWRLEIEEAFNAPLYRTYGSVEFPRLGFECRHQNGYHLLPQAAVVEVLREDGSPCEAGEEGEIVLTHLNNFTMPLIRYRIGDRGAFSTLPACGYGSTYPLLASVTGRTDDFVILPGGRNVSARALTPFMVLDEIKRYQITQKSPADFEVFVIPARSFRRETEGEIRSRLRQACGNEQLRVNIRKVDSLPVASSGKFRLVTREFDRPSRIPAKAA